MGVARDGEPGRKRLDADAMTGPDPFDPAFQAELSRLFRLRRDVRRFLTEPVDEALLAGLLDEVGYAPSVGLSEPWRYVRVEDAAARAAVRDSFERCNEAALRGYDGDDARLYASLKLHGLEAAPVQLAVFSDTGSTQGRGLGTATMPEMRDYSVVCSVMLLWLAARARGLGMGWVSILEPEAVAEAVGAEPDWRLIAYLCLGWPAEEGEIPALETAGWERRRDGAGRRP